MKIRSFLAFDIPDEVRGKLSNLVADFREKEKRIKWVDVENLHVTMKFFGDIEEEFLFGEISSQIEAVTAKNKAINLYCQGIGVFPNWKYPSVVWAGFSGDSESIIKLQSGIENALLDSDVHKDERMFRLHLTLGRVKGRIKNSPIVDLVEKLGPVKFGEVPVKRLLLYKSVLTKAGPVYTQIGEFRLQGDG